MISAQYMLLRAFFSWFYDVICSHWESIVVLKPLATRLQHLVFSRSKWSMKIQRWNMCIMLFKWEWCNSLLLDTKENVYLRLLGVTIIWHNYRKMSLGKSWSKILTKTENNGKMIMRKKKRLLDFLLFHIKGNQQNI